MYKAMINNGEAHSYETQNWKTEDSEAQQWNIHCSETESIEKHWTHKAVRQMKYAMQWNTEYWKSIETHRTVKISNETHNYCNTWDSEIHKAMKYTGQWNHTQNKVHRAVNI